MVTTVTGPVGATYDAVFAGLSATLTRVGGVVGFDGGAIAPDQKTYVTDGIGVLTMVDLKPGRYELRLSVPVNEDTSQTVLREATGTVLADAGASITLEAFLDKNAEPITPSLVQQAKEWAIRAQAWAESETPPDPDNPDSRSSKTIAETLGTLSELEDLADRAEDAALAVLTGATINTLIRSIENDANGTDFIRAHWGTWKKVNLPDDAGGGEFYNQFGDYSPKAISNIINAMRRLSQLEAVRWTPAAPFPEARVYFPSMFSAGFERQGVPYSTVLTKGRVIGFDISLETFVTAAANPDSVHYGPEIEFGDGAGGRAFDGNVCSSFIGYGFDLPYPPNTETFFNFAESVGEGFTRFDPIDYSDIRTGDVFVAPRSHIEIVTFVGQDSIALLDQTFRSVRRVSRSRSALATYVGQRRYINIRYNWEDANISGPPDPFAPLLGEDLPTPEIELRLMLDRGNKSNYALGSDVRFNVRDAATVTGLVIEKDGVPQSPVAVSNESIHVETYDEAGDIGQYRAWLEFSDGPDSAPVEWCVADVQSAVDVNTAAVGEPITVTFTCDGCQPVALVMFGRETPPHRLLTDDEIAAGEVVILAPGGVDGSPADRSIRIFIRAVTPFGSIYSGPYDNTDLRVQITE